MRKDFSRIDDKKMVPNLISLQLESYKNFLKSEHKEKRGAIGIKSSFDSFFPLESNDRSSTLEFVEYSLSEPKYSAGDCLISGKTYSSPLKAKLRLVLWNLGNEGEDSNSTAREIKAIKEQDVYLCDIPLMTETGSFVINGAERVVVSQMHRSPGVFFDREDSKTSNVKIYTAKIVPSLGSWLDFEFDSKDILYFRIDRKRKMHATSLLRAIGMTTREIIRTFYDEVELRHSKNGWVTNFNYEAEIGNRVSYDVVDSSTQKVKIKANTKITRKIVDKLKEEGFKEYLVSKDALSSYVLSDDITDDASKQVLLEAGSTITEESLEAFEKLKLKKISVVNIDTSKVGPYIYNTLTLDKNQSQQDALFEIYRFTKLGDSTSSFEVAEKFLNNLFFEEGRYDLSDVGRMKMNYRLGTHVDVDKTHLVKQDVVETVKILNVLKHNDSVTDDIDNLVNRRVRSVGELVENQFRIGLSRIEKNIKEKLNSGEIDTMMPQNLINSKPLSTAIKDFFATSQLSQFMDQANPLSEVTHKRRISALGPGGLVRDRAGFEVRDVHSTHYGRICPIETPEGPNIGLINSLATYARVNKYGFIETPYRKVVKGAVKDEVVYLSAMEEKDLAIAQSNAEMDKEGKITDKLVSCRKNDEFLMLPPDEINFMDISPKQLVSVSTTLIPFVENDDAKRALLGSNMQRQAVPLMKAESPIVGTGMEGLVARDSGCMILAKNDGIVTYVDAAKIIIKTNEDSSATTITNLEIHHLAKHNRSNQDTIINQRPLVSVGQKVKKGDVIADAQSTRFGELALGKNALVAFIPWNGYNYQDSILISERLVKDDVFTSVHIEKFEVVARDTRLGPEEITRDIPNVSEATLSKLDETGIIHIGAEVKPGDILVGKVSPKSKSPMTPEEKLLKVIFGEKASDVKDTSLYVEQGVKTGVVVDVRIFSRKGIEKDERSSYIDMQKINVLSEEKDSQIVILEDDLREKVIDLVAGEKLVIDLGDMKKGSKLDSKNLQKASRHFLTKIVIDGTAKMKKLDALTSSFEEKVAKLEKNFNDQATQIKEGDDLPQGVLKIVEVFIATKSRLQPGDKMSGRHGNKGIVSKIIPVESMPYLEDGTPVDIVLNPLGVPSRMNIGQILEVHLGWAAVNIAKRLNDLVDEIDGKNKDEILKKVRHTLLQVYTREDETKNIEGMKDNEVINFVRSIKGGLPFATGVFEDIKIDDIDNLLKISGVDKSGQVTLVDGKSGEKFDKKITVGSMYMLKLDHLVDDKIHARSIGPYSLITQQPLGGKSHSGGQRFGEMECWALQAYGAAYTLQEMLTVKSDDVIGRIRIYESIVQGNQDFTCDIPESFNVMVKEVRSLGLNIELIKE